MNADKFILAIAEKAGIPASDPDIIKVLAHTELNRIEISDGLVGSIQQSLLSIEDAKNNHPAIKSHYFGEAMANLDRGLSDAYDAAGFTPDEIATFNKERSSTKRIPLVVKALKDKIAEAAKTPDKGGNADALTQKINELNAELANHKATLSAKEKEFNDNLTTFKTKTALSKKLTLKTVYDNMSPEAREIALEALLNKEIQDNSAQVVLDETGNLKLIKKDGSNYFDENNKPLSVDSFIEKTFAKHKILPQNTASNSSTTVQGEQQSGQPATTTGGQQQKNNYSYLFQDAKNAFNNQPVV